MPFGRDEATRRAAGRKHAQRVRECKCGRRIRGNAYSLHVRTCETFIAYYAEHNPDVLLRRRILMPKRKLP